MTNELLHKVADLMRRCDGEYCASHSVSHTTDDEWDDLLAEVEEACDPCSEDEGKPDPPRRVQRPQSDALAVGC